MDFSALFPAAPSYFPSLLGEEQARLAQQQAQQQGLLGAALGLLSAGGPSRTPVSFGQSLAQGLQAGQQAYSGALKQRVEEAQVQRQLAEEQRKLQEQQAIRQYLPSVLGTGEAGAPRLDVNALRDLLAKAPSAVPAITALTKSMAEILPKPEYVYEKLPDGTVVKLDKRGIEPAQQVWAAPKAPKLDDAGLVYAQVNFGKTDGLSPEQMSEAFNFQMRPSPRDLMDLAIKAQAVKNDTGVDLLPQVSALGQRVFNAPSAAAVATPVAAPSAAPVTGAPAVASAAPAAVPAVPAAPGFMQASPQNPMVTNEDVPLKLRNELRASQPAVLKSSIQAIREIRDLRDTAEKLLANESGLKSAVGLGGQTLSKIPGTPAADAAAVLDNLKNRSFTAGILALRQSSPTGSGVGSLTEREGARFENLQASLGQAQSFEQVRDQLKQLVKYSDETLGLIKDAYSTDFGPNTTLDEVLKRSVVQQPSGAGSARERLNRIWGR
jgi:hypothetical protein